MIQQKASNVFNTHNEASCNHNEDNRHLCII